MLLYMSFEYGRYIVISAIDYIHKVQTQSSHSFFEGIYKKNSSLLKFIRKFNMKIVVLKPPRYLYDYITNIRIKGKKKL